MKNLLNLYLVILKNSMYKKCTIITKIKDKSPMLNG